MQSALSRIVAMAIASCSVLTLLSVVAHAASFKVIYNFQGGNDGANPYAPLININGTLYGTTLAGGAGTEPACNPAGCGTIFSLAPGGTETVLYKFQGGSDGYGPCCIVKAGNAFIGITQDTLFSFTAQGKFKVVGTAPASGFSTYGQPLTQIDKTSYGVVTGNAATGCSNGSCGYIFAVVP